MKIFSLERQILIKASMDEVWEYFSTPLNLNDLTPEDMRFHVLSDLKGKKMYQGMIINYKVAPVLNIPLRWTTEITHCVDKQFFVDEQRFGPYAFWHHQHHFEQVPDGVLMTDIVHYAMPFSFLGWIVNALFVKQKLNGIFDFRNQFIEKKFNLKP